MPGLHPCGSLPVTGVTVALWYCHHHQAWWADFSAFTQRSDEPLEHLSSHHEWGPFDSYDEVIEAVREHLERDAATVTS